MKIFKKITINKEREIQFFNIPILSYGTKYYKDSKKNVYFNLFPKSFKYQVYDELLKITENKHDFIIIVRAGLGEAYLLNFMLDEILHRYNAKKPCFVGHRDFYKELFSLYYPNIPFYTHNINTNFMFNVLDKKYDKYKNCLFNVNPSPLKNLQNLLAQYEKGVVKDNYSYIIKNFNNTKNYKNKQIKYKNNIENIVELKFPNIKNEQFIFVVKDANFVKPLPANFWETLISQLENLGYKIVYNSKDISIQEARYIASYAKALIAIRGGFCEILSTLNVPKHIIYTPCKHNDLKNIVDLFSLKKYPFVNPQTIFEYDTINTKIETIYENIIGGLKIENIQ